MHIGIDARTLNRPHRRGIGQYLAEIAPRIAAHARVTLYGDRHDFPMAFSDEDTISVDVFEVKGYRFHSWEQIGLPWKAARHRLDILHCPAARAPFLQTAPTVVTIHDTMPWDFQDSSWPAGFYRDSLIPAAYRRAKAIITVSNNSKADILRRWPELKPKLHVIHNGVNALFHAVEPAALSDSLLSIGIRSPYLTYVGGALPRKRLAWALDVWKKINDPQLQLVLLGLDQDSETEIDQAIPPHLRSLLLRALFIPDTDMPRLYQNACAVLYPTMYEGFGLPAIEAQAVGTSVLMSSVGSLAELCGPGSIILPAEDLDAWVTAAKRVIRQRKEAPQVDEQARIWARGFSWEESARKHQEIYRSIVTKSARQPVGSLESTSQII